MYPRPKICSRLLHFGLAVISFGCESGQNQHARTGVAPIVEFRAVHEHASSPNDQVVTGPAGETLYVASKPFVTDLDAIEAKETTTSDGRRAVLLKLSDVGAAATTEHTTAAINQHVAIVLRGEVISLPVIQSPLGRQLLVSKFPGELEADEVQSIIQAVRDRQRGK